MTFQVKRLILALGTTAGLLALGAPVAAQASTHAAVAPNAAGARAATAQQLIVGQLNPQTAITYYLVAPFNGCTFSVGDRYEGSGGAAVGMATINCPSPHTYRIVVYLDYQANNGQDYTYLSNTAGTPYYGYGESAWTGCVTNVSTKWTTYASISIDGSPYSVYFLSGKDKSYSAGPNCP